MVCVSDQKMESGSLSDWLMGALPSSKAPIGYQSSKNPQDWLMEESKVRETSTVTHMVAVFHSALIMYS